MIERAVIFDLDGTLLDTLESLANCFNRVLTQNGFATHSVEAYRYFIGDGARVCMQRCLPSNIDERVIDRLLAQQQSDYHDNWRRDVTIYDGISECLDRLTASNVPLAVLTNKDHPFAVKCVEAFFNTDCFAAIQGFEGVIPHKPDPRGAQTLLKRLNLSADQVVLVGDTSVDIETATNANLRSIGALWGFREEQELREAGATHIIAHPLEILDLI